MSIDRRYWKITIAFVSVIQTPQAIGMPTKHQNNAAFGSSPPLPIPNDPLAAPADAVYACKAATSSGFMNHLSASGLIRKLQMKPPTSMPSSTYMVTS